MEDLSEKSIRENCPHCHKDSQAFRHPLEETENFWIVADSHPLVAGHILIIPKEHISCIGEYSEVLLSEFKAVYQKVQHFVKERYGSVSTFEHGKIGQTVFHSHIHVLPFTGTVNDIVPEGQEALEEVNDISELKNIFQTEQKYLFFSIGERMWVVDTMFGKPRFFRDRFASALQNPERADWKAMHLSSRLMATADAENEELKQRWKQD